MGPGRGRSSAELTLLDRGGSRKDPVREDGDVTNERISEDLDLLTDYYTSRTEKDRAGHSDLNVKANKGTPKKGGGQRGALKPRSLRARRR